MRGAILSLAVATTLLTGCASDNWFRLKKEAFPTASAKNPAVRILAVWQVGEGQGPDGLTTRGFAGQIFFLDANDQIPAKVDGDVRVYVFDDQGTAEERDKPLHQFDYPRESWKVRMTTTKMGPAYVVFVPYTRKGSHKAVCSLRLRYTPAEGGPPLFSDMSQVSLPGRDNSPEERFALDKSRERTAEYLGDQDARDLPRRDEVAEPKPVEARGQRVASKQPASRAPLTAGERQRLMAEALARAEADGLVIGEHSVRHAAASDERARPSRVRPATHAEDDGDEFDEPPPPRRSTARGTHPLLRESEADQPVMEPRESARREATRQDIHPLLRQQDDADYDEFVEEQPRRTVNRLSRAGRTRDSERRDDEPHVSDEMDLDELEQAAIEELAQLSRAERDPARRAMRTWSVDLPK